MQNSLGLNVRWLEPGQLDALNPTLAPGRTLGGTYCAEDGYLTPPRNVTAYAVALAVSGVEVRERVSFTGLDVTGGAVTGVRTSAGPITAPLVVLTGGPEIAEVAGAGRSHRPGGRGPAPGRRDRAASRPRPGPGADGLRPVGRPVLAARGGRPAVRDEQPGRAARRGGLRGRALPGADAPAPGRAGPGHRRSRPAPPVGGHDRLHPRPPADHRPGPGPRRRGRRPGRSAGHRGRDRGQRGRRRDDVGARRGPRRRRRRPHRHLRGGRRDRPRPRPVRRRRPQQAGTDPIALPFPEALHQERTHA